MTPKWTDVLRATHLRLMRAISNEIAANKGVYVLKGGTALLLARGLDRFSTDLDYDTSKKLTLAASIKSGAQKAGLRVLGVRVLRDSEIVQKYVADYITADKEESSLKVETRVKEIRLSDTERTADGLRIYLPQIQLAQKLGAAMERGGRAPRDLYDIAFLAEKFPSAAVANASTLRAFASNPDALLATYAPMWEQDEILRTRPIENLLLRIAEIIDNLPRQEAGMGQKLEAPGEPRQKLPSRGLSLD